MGRITGKHGRQREFDMTQSATQIEVGTGEEARVIAVRHRAGPPDGPGIVWLGGYRSDMAGTKAVELDRWAGENGHACTRFDYSGHGESGGDFKLGTISRWLEESLAVFDRFTAGPQLLVGSSMGGWIAIRMLQELRKSGRAERVRGLLPAGAGADFTSDLHEPLLTEAQKRDLDTKGYYEEETPYGRIPTSSRALSSRTGATTG